MGRLWDGYKKRGFYGIAITAHLLEARDLMRHGTVVGSVTGSGLCGNEAVRSEWKPVSMRYYSETVEIRPFCRPSLKHMHCAPNGLRVCSVKLSLQSRWTAGNHKASGIMNSAVQRDIVDKRHNAVFFQIKLGLNPEDPICYVIMCKILSIKSVNASFIEITNGPFSVHCG